jgi:hypothetical protein
LKLRFEEFKNLRHWTPRISKKQDILRIFLVWNGCHHHMTHQWSYKVTTRLKLQIYMTPGILVHGVKKSCECFRQILIFQFYGTRCNTHASDCKTRFCIIVYPIEHTKNERLRPLGVLYYNLQITDYPVSSEISHSWSHPFRAPSPKGLATVTVRSSYYSK